MRLLAFVLGLLGLATPAAGDAKLLKRLAQERTNVPAAGGPNSSPLTGVIDSLWGAGIDGSKWGALFDEPRTPLTDLEFANIELELMQDALSGDLMGSFRKMLLHFNVLFDLWADIDVFRTVLENFPLFGAIRGIDAIMEKDKAQITFEDTQEGVALLYNFIIKAMDAIDSVRDPEKFATKLQLYATLDDPKFLSLVARIESGEKEANVELQKYVLTREMGDIVDLDMYGFNGIEPEWIKQTKKISIEDDAQFWHKIVDDPVAKRYMEDPGLAYREFSDLYK